MHASALLIWKGVEGDVLCSAMPHLGSENPIPYLASQPPETTSLSDLRPCHFSLSFPKTCIAAPTPGGAHTVLVPDNAFGTPACKNATLPRCSVLEQGLGRDVARFVNLLAPCLLQSINTCWRRRMWCWSQGTFLGHRNCFRNSYTAVLLVL